MKKKKLILAAVLILLGVWLFRTQTLMDVAKLDMETANVGSIIVMEEGELRRGEFEDRKAMAELFEMLKNAEVRFDGWWGNSIRTEGEELLYHLRFYDKKWLPSSELFYICTSGQIYYGHFLYKLQGEDMQKCTDILEKILEEYEVKS